MAKKVKGYPAEFRHKILELARSGKTATALAREYEVARQTIMNWIKQRRDRWRSPRRYDNRRPDRNTSFKKANTRARNRARDSKKSRGLVCSGNRSDSQQRFEFVKSYQATFKTTKLCTMLGISKSGYYAWRSRPPSKHQRSDIHLGDRIEALHRQSRGNYGRPRIEADLRDEGFRVSNKRIARLMRERKIHGATRRKGFKTTVRDRCARPAPDLVDRKFTASAPDQLWVSDITYVPTWTGFLFLAIVLDVYSRRVVGWSMANHLRTELVLDALEMALLRRRPKNVIHHSDQGCQYTSIAFGRRCAEAGVRPSMGSVGDCYDNAMCESFNATLECELLVNHRFKNQREAALCVFDFIEGWYNPRRWHSAIGNISPMEYERRMSQAA